MMTPAKRQILNRRSAMVLMTFLVLSGCKEVLYSDLNEAEANEMTSLLEASGIELSRKRDKDGVYQVLVGKDQVGRANSILVSNGLPRKRFVSMDQVFDAQGLVGSPFEERVRYIFALEQKLTESLVSIHGVRDARVTVSLPEKSKLGKPTAPANASIILHYETDFQVSDAVPKIKTLIANSVQGLDYEGVSVVTFPAQSADLAPTPSGGSFLVSAAHAAGGTQEPPQTATGVQAMLGTAMAGLSLLLLLLFILRSKFTALRAGGR